MDNRRWDTAQILAGGILDLPMPETTKPKDLKLVDVDEDDLSEETLRAGLAKGGLSANMYYGCWSIWKAGDGFDGELFQYRSMTGSLKGATLDEAVEQAMEWGHACYG